MSVQYKGLKANLEKVEVTESEIDRQLERLRRETPAVTVVTDRPAQLGDEVVLDYAGSCDGVAFDGGTAQGQTLTLGSGMFIPGFEDQLVGTQLEEPVTVRVTFPEAYHSEDLAGKAAEFACVLHEIRIKSEYDLDDAFAKAVGSANMEELRRGVGESLRDYYGERAEMELQERLMRQVADTVEFSATEAEVEQAVTQQLETMRAQLAQRNLTLEAYCQFSGTTEAQLREDARPEAQHALRAQAAVDEIVKLENLRAEEQEIADILAEICQRNQLSMEQLQAYRSEEFDAAVERSVLTRKVLGLIRDCAQITAS